MLRFNIIKAINFSLPQQEKLRQALFNFTAAVNSAEFKHWILNHPPFNNWLGLSNAQILAKIHSGREIDNDSPDQEADFIVCLTSDLNDDTLGETRSGVIYTSERYFDSHLPVNLAGHYAHEYCHLLGFEDPNAGEDDLFNVPYQVGNFVRNFLIDSMPNVIV